jgi:hypothetical protein
MALSSVFCSLSSSTTMASTLMPVANLISSIAPRMVGSDTATNSRLPRRNSGSTRCLASSLSPASLIVSRSIATASRSISGTPNSLAAAIAMSRAEAKYAAPSWTRMGPFMAPPVLNTQRRLIGSIVHAVRSPLLSPTTIRLRAGSRATDECGWSRRSSSRQSITPLFASRIAMMPLGALVSTLTKTLPSWTSGLDPIESPILVRKMRAPLSSEYA